MDLIVDDDDSMISDGSPIVCDLSSESLCSSVVSTIGMEQGLIVGSMVTGISTANQEYSSCLLQPMMGNAISVSYLLLLKICFKYL